MVLCATSQHCLTKLQDRKAAAAMSKTKFRHVHFLCNFCVISGGHKTAARRARCSYD